MKTLVIAAMILALAMVGVAQAIPTLQLYVEGGTYDGSSDTWVVDAASFTLLVLGDVGSYGPIADVYLTAAYSSSESGLITLTPTTADGVTDPSTPSDPIAVDTGSGTAPTTGDGTLLPSHGVYGPGTSWTKYSIGDFTLTDSPIGDFITAFPTSFPSNGQINAYDVEITGFTMVHFDAFDHILGKNNIKYVAAPFSHDAQAVPEPSTLLLFGSGLAGVGLYRRMKG